jgi:two-component sensor histidine kinase
MPEDSNERVEDLLAMPELGEALESGHFKRFLDHLPLGIMVAEPKGNHEWIVYANRECERLTGQTVSALVNKRWNCLDVHRSEDDPQRTLGQAIIEGDDYLGAFSMATSEDGPVLADAFANLIEADSDRTGFRLVALVCVTERDRVQREHFAQQIREKDTLLKELQHRVKNNLQLLTALIRLEAREARRGGAVNLDRLAGRVASLQLLYQDLSADGHVQDIDLGHYLSQIASAVISSHGYQGIQIDLKLDRYLTSINVAMPTGLVVNELLTNAFKYAFHDRDVGTISLRGVHHSEDRYLITVADDGVGLPHGITWPPEGKISALMVQTLRENAQMDLTVESSADGGTRIVIDIAPRKRRLRGSGTTA